MCSDFVECDLRGRENGYEMLTAMKVNSLMDAVKGNRVSRWEAHCLVDPYVAHGEPVNGGLALSGAQWLHGFSMTDNGNENDPQRWILTDEDVAGRIADWQREYRSVQNGDIEAWKKWMRPRPKLSSLELLENLFRRIRGTRIALPDRRYATVVAFLQGYDNGHRSKLRLDGFNDWLVQSYCLDPYKPWHVNVLHHIYGLSVAEDGMIHLDTSQDEEAMDRLYPLLREYLIHDGLNGGCENL